MEDDHSAPNAQVSSQVAHEVKSRTVPSPDQYSPFYQYNASIDPQSIIRRYARADISPHPLYLTNYLGVLIDPKFVPNVLSGLQNTVEPIPIPANWHADIAEWGAALRAVDLSRELFTIIELGCGWGCWLNITGVAARATGRDVYLIGVEGDQGHIRFAQEATAANGFLPSQVVLHHGIAAAQAGTALFPYQESAGASWGLEPVFGANAQQVREAQRVGSHNVLPMIPLADLVKSHSRIDLLHIDIQGGEIDLVAGSLKTLNAKIAYLLIGAHSRQIEGRLIEILLEAGWVLEIERPAIFTLHPNGEMAIVVDGVQGWRNRRLCG